MERLQILKQESLCSGNRFKNMFEMKDRGQHSLEQKEGPLASSGTSKLVFLKKITLELRSKEQ